MPKNSVEELWDQFTSWVDDGVVAHPNAPASGGGPGSFRMPGGCGRSPHPRGIPQTNSPAARRAGSWDFSTEYLIQRAQEWHEQYKSSIVVVAVEIWARRTVTDTCFAAGVVAGLLESIGGTVVGLMKTLYRLNELQTSAEIALARMAKIFVLAEIYDREHVKESVLQDPMFNEMVRRFLTESELQDAHNRKAKIIEEVKKIALNAPQIIKQLGAKIGPGLMKIVDSYPERWNRFVALSRQGTMDSMFHAGEVFGSLLFDVIMLILAIIGGAEFLGARISAMFPEVATAAEAIRLEEGAAAASEGLADLDELASTLSETPKAPKPPKPRPEPKVPDPVPEETPQAPTPKGGTAIGKSSGRPFDPEKAGGPIQQLSTKGTQITNEGIANVEKHISRFGPYEPNDAMVARLRSIAKGEMPPTEYDLNYYTHELREAERYKNLGWETGQPANPDAAYDLWNNAHTATLEDYGLKDGQLYHPDALKLDQ